MVSASPRIAPWGRDPLKASNRNRKTSKLARDWDREPEKWQRHATGSCSFCMEASIIPAGSFSGRTWWTSTEEAAQRHRIQQDTNTAANLRSLAKASCCTGWPVHSHSPQTSHLNKQEGWKQLLHATCKEEPANRSEATHTTKLLLQQACCNAFVSQVTAAGVVAAGTSREVTCMGWCMGWLI